MLDLVVVGLVGCLGVVEREVERWMSDCSTDVPLSGWYSKCRGIICIRGVGIRVVVVVGRRVEDEEGGRRRYHQLHQVAMLCRSTG